MSDKPLVSVVVPTYNRAHLIGESIQSVIDQTYSHWELIIVDDGSEDGTAVIVSRYNDNRIKYVKVKHSGSLGMLRNKGIENSSGQYIAFLDSDDLWTKEKLTFQLALFKKHPEAGFVFGNVNFFGDIQIPEMNYEELFIGNVFLPLILESRFIFRPSSLILKRDLIENIGMMDEKFKIGAEMDFLYRISRNHIAIFTNQKVVNIRMHPNNTSKNIDAEFLSYSDSIAIAEKLKQQGALTIRQHRMVVCRYYYKMGLLGLRNNKTKLAVQCFIDYIKISPFHWKGWIRLIQSCARRFKFF